MEIVLENVLSFLPIAIIILALVYNYTIGKKAMKQFSDFNPDTALYFEKWTSGHSLKSFFTKYGGANKVLHVAITDKELIIKTSNLFAFIAFYYDLLHRIPFEKIEQTELKKSMFGSKLHVRFKDAKGIDKEFVILSKNNEKIKALLEHQMERSPSST